MIVVSSDDSLSDLEITKEGDAADLDPVLALLEKYNVLNDSRELTDPLTEDELMRKH